MSYHIVVEGQRVQSGFVNTDSIEVDTDDLDKAITLAHAAANNVDKNVPVAMLGTIRIYEKIKGKWSLLPVYYELLLGSV